MGLGLGAMAGPGHWGRGGVGPFTVRPGFNKFEHVQGGFLYATGVMITWHHFPACEQIDTTENITFVPSLVGGVRV